MYFHKAIGIVFYFLFFTAFSQEMSSGFKFAKLNRKFTRISFQLANNLIVVPLFLNEKADTLNFVLDTGVGTTIFIDSTFLQTMQADTSNLRKVIVKGGGIGEIITSYLVPKQHLQIGSLVASQQNVLVCSQTLHYISTYAGMRICGIVGYDFFRNLVVKIDYIRKELLIYEPQYFTEKILPKCKPSQIHKITLQRQKPYIWASYVNESNDTIPLRLLIDTGAGHSVSLDIGTRKGIELPKKHIQSNLGVAVNGVVLGKIARIKQLQIGKFSWLNVLTTFPDSSLVAFRDEGVSRNGSIGMGILERFDVTLNYPQQFCIFSPNLKYNKGFDIGFSGLELISQGKFYREYKIVAIHPLSEAHRAGLQVGDEILAINNHFTSLLNISQVYELIDAKEQTLNLLIRRAGKLQVVSFRTKRII
ncbi:aspartyl protease family protein [Raineya orbicola]|jgi:predicted aspartyl protease|uniref:Aspartyl protease n=1 Tax=Raineya orbicola TaxID=2016530 RepID=A0A2N3IIC1_9BACT|nr:aspartyl protease family protein [Raineya orbicola]PKQ70082.1 Aspartyl protease [Raineya orbicola]